MITAHGTYDADRGFLNPLVPSNGDPCEICGSIVPEGFTVCYGCDLELSVGEWPQRPRRHAYDLGQRCSHHRARKRRT